MKILFVGLGSIGKRHLENLVLVMKERHIPFTIDALRHSEGVLEENIKGLLSNIYTDISQIDGEYDATFITNITGLHYETLKNVVPFSKTVFIEKPVFTGVDEDIDALKLKKDGIYYVACPLRRSPVLTGIKGILNEINPLAVRSISSSYLPDWRKEGDYRTKYSAIGFLGGGVRLDLIHEIDYLIDLFGVPQHIKSESARVSSLEINSEDISCYILRYPYRIITLHIDYIGRAPRREIELFCEDDTIIGDILNNSIHFLKSNTVKELKPIDIHREEMKYFLDLINGDEENINDLFRAITTLKYALV